MVTIKDIAKQLGISHTTVSRALNNSPLVKPETREHIKSVAKELNYVPNFNAKSLVNQKNYMIGLFFSSISQGTSSSFLVDTITGIRSVLEASYSLSVEGIDEIQNLSDINFQRYDGILVMSQSETDQAFIEYLKQQNLPFVVVNRLVDDPEIMNVVADDAEGVMTGIEYAITLGHKKIGYIGGLEVFHSSNERRKGLIAMLEKHELPIVPAFFRSGSYSLESGFQQMTQLLKNQELPTLIFCANDDMAIGAMRAIDAAGLTVPNDLSIIGFDNTPITSYLNPPLTTIHKPLNKISRLGTELLLKQINREAIAKTHYEIPTTLMVRQSVKNLLAVT